MDKIYKDVLQITKEIVVKFVEVGRITPANFAENFPAVYAVVLETLSERDPRARPRGGKDAAPDAPTGPAAPDGFGPLLAETGRGPSGPSGATPA